MRDHAWIIERQEPGADSWEASSVWNTKAEATKYAAEARRLSPEWWFRVVRYERAA